MYERSCVGRRLDATLSVGSVRRYHDDVQGQRIAERLTPLLSAVAAKEL